MMNCEVKRVSMREILFRGKRDNGEWVEGFYACVLDTHYIISMRNSAVAVLTAAVKSLSRICRQITLYRCTSAARTTSLISIRRAGLVIITSPRILLRNLGQ